MTFSARVHYGLSALYDLAFHGQGRAAQAREIAERQGVPLRYLEQILQELRRAGLVEARRGPRGGYALVRAPEQVTLADLMAALNDGGAAANERAPSNDRGVTDLVLGDLAARMKDLYAQVTLADVVARAEALGIARAPMPPQMYFI